MSEEQGGPHTTAEGPGSLLTARLLSRGTDSLGLIDVRRAERHYARIMDWLAGRTPLLERLRTRYGLAEGQGMTGLAFAEPRGWEGAQTGGEGINLSVKQDVHLSTTHVNNLAAAPDSPNAPAAEQIFTLAAHIPDDDAAAPTEAKRIARRGVPTFSPASPATGRDTAASRGPGEVVGREQGEVSRPLVELTFPVEERASDNAPTPTPRPAMKPAQQSTSAPMPRAIPSVEERVTPSTAEQDKPLTRGSTVTSDADVVNIASTASGPTGAAQPNVPRVIESRVNESSDADAVPLLQSSRAVVVNEAVGTASLRSGTASDAKGVADGVKVIEAAKVTAASIEGVKLPVAGETRAASVSFETPRPLAQARETRAAETHEFAGAARPPEHLRAQPPLPLAAHPAAAERAEMPHRHHDDSHAFTRAPAPDATETYMPGHAPAQARAEEINVRRLTEQVSRHLTRRLLVERERRGLGRK